MNLHATAGPCDSCRNVGKQMTEKYPGIQINTLSDEQTRSEYIHNEDLREKYGGNLTYGHFRAPLRETGGYETRHRARSPTREDMSARAVVPRAPRR